MEGYESRQDDQEGRAKAEEVAQQLVEFVGPLLEELDKRLDKRLVRTFVGLMQAIIRHRNRPLGLLLSELGGCLLSPAQAPAGTKRISNLLRSRKWSAELLSAFLFGQAREEVERLEASGETAVAVWDGTVWEKPESIAIEGLCAVRSRKAERLKHVRPGYYAPPPGKVCVPGLEWLVVLVTGLGSPQRVRVAGMRWWTHRGVLAISRREVEEECLKRYAQAWGQRVLHVFDRGFAGSRWLKCLASAEVRFVMRWPRGYSLLGLQGQRCRAGQLVMRKRSWDKRLLWDYHARQYRETGVIAVPVGHPDYPGPLWLVVARQTGRSSPWYLLTNVPVETAEEAWRIVQAYQCRWQVESAIRFLKSELAIESPRLWFWENRMKLLMIVTLVYSFLVSLLGLEQKEWLIQLLREWCHRTGRKMREALCPLYRLRAALARLWTTYPPPLPTFQNSG